MTIPKLTPYTGQVANPGGSQTQTEFTQNMFDQLSYEAQLATELEATIDGMNQAVTDVENSANAASASATAAEAAASTAGYQGLWPDTGGSANKGDTWQTQVGGTPTGDYYTALQNTSVDPVGDDVNWKVNVTGSYVNQAQEELINGSIFPVIGMAKNGDTVPVGTTHLRVDVDGNPAIVEMVNPVSGAITSLNETEVDTSDGIPASPLRPVTNKHSIIQQNNESLVNAIGSAVAAGGVNFVVLGDSTKCGVGGAGGPYGQTTKEIRNGAANRLGFSMVCSDPNFVGIDPSYFDYRTVSSDSLSLEAAYPSAGFRASDNPRYETNVLSKSRNSLDNLCVYYHQRTSDTAARAIVTVYDLNDVQIAQQTLDSYTNPITFGTAGSFDVGGRLAKFDIALGGSYRGVRVVIDQVDVIDRGNGISADGTILIHGFSLGSGVNVHNLAVSSTTLTEGSDANILRGVDTSERIALAKSLDVNVISIGWGTNDSKTGVTTLNQFKQDYKALIDDLKSWKSDIKIFLETAPRGLGSPYSYNYRYNAVIRDLAIENECGLFDVERIFDQSPSSFYADSVHPSHEGYQALAYALCSFTKIPYFESNAFDYSNRYGDKSASWSLPVTSDTSGSFVSVLDETIDFPSWATGFTISATINVGLSGSDLSNCAGKIEVNGVALAEQVINAAQVGGIALDQLVLYREHEPQSFQQSLNVVLKLRNYGIRIADSTSRVNIRFF